MTPIFEIGEIVVKMNSDVMNVICLLAFLYVVAIASRGK